MSETPEVTDEVTEGEDEVIDLGALTEDQLRERVSTLDAQIEELRAQPRTLDTVRDINALRAERNETVEAANELITIDEVPEVTVAEAPADEPEAEEAEETDEAPASDEEAPEAEAAADVEVADTIEQEAPVSDTGADADALAAAEDVVSDAAVTASADRPIAPSVPERPKAAYVAGAGQSEFTPGQPMNGFEDLALAWESRREALAKPGVGTQRAIVASLPGFEQDFSPEDLLSPNNSATRNDALIREAVEAHRARLAGEPVEAHVAAICDPLDIIREIPEDGNTATPFASLFPSRPASRLGFQYTPASALSVAASGVTLWEESDQNSVDEADPSTWKPAVLIECSSPVEVKAKELVTAALVDTSTEMSSPEKVREFMAKLATARARTREQHLLSLFDATDTTYTRTADAAEGTLVAAVRAVLELVPALLYTERLNPQTYTAVVEPGFMQKIAIDNALVGEKESAADAKAFFESETGIRLVELHDFDSGNDFSSSTTLGALPSVTNIRLVPTADYIYSATGEQSTGWQTDPQLARQNRMQAFSSEWLLLAKHGVAPAATIALTSVASGTRPATA